MAGVKCLEAWCMRCQRAYPVWYTGLSDVIVAKCSKCGNTAQINITKILEVPAELRWAVAQNPANGLVTKS